MPNGLGSWGEKRDAEIFLQWGCFWSKFATQISVSAPLHFFPNIFFVFSFKQEEEGEEEEEEEEEEEDDEEEEEEEDEEAEDGNIMTK